MKYNTLEDFINADDDMIDKNIIYVDNDEIFMFIKEKEVFRMHPQNALIEALKLHGFNVDLV